VLSLFVDAIVVLQVHLSSEGRNFQLLSFKLNLVVANKYRRTGRRLDGVNKKSWECSAASDLQVNGGSLRCDGDGLLDSDGEWPTAAGERDEGPAAPASRRSNRVQDSREGEALRPDAAANVLACAAMIEKRRR
jgi:hypothetical protein